MAFLHVLQSKYKKDKEDLSCTLHSLLPETLETQFVKEMALTHSEVGEPCVCVCACVCVCVCVCVCGLLFISLLMRLTLSWFVSHVLDMLPLFFIRLFG